MLYRPDLGPKPALGYIASALDRAAEHRNDAEFPAALEQQPDARAYAVAGELVPMKKTAAGLDPLFTLAEARALGTAGETVFLRLADRRGRFGVWLDPRGNDALKGREDLHVSDLRSIAVQGLVGVDHLAALAEAKALLHWHARHRFCATCGHATNVVQGG